MLSRNWSILASVIASFLLCGADWIEFKSPDGKFKARFPVTPPEEKVDTAAGPGRVYSVDNGTVMFAIMRIELPKLIAPDEIEAALDRARDGGVARVKGKLLSEKKIKLDDKHSGRESLIEVPSEKKFMRQRCHLAGKELYLLFALGPSEDWTRSKEPLQFLNSFGLAK